MIVFEMSLIPYGRRLYGETPLLRGSVWSARDAAGRPVHAWRVVDNEGAALGEGEVPKEASGHRNPVRLLRSVLAGIDVDALPPDHVTTVWDLPDGAPRKLAEREDAVAEAVAEAVDRLRELAAEGRADALDAVAREIARLRADLP